MFIGQHVQVGLPCCLYKNHPFGKLIREFQTHSTSPHHVRNQYAVNNVQACIGYTEWKAPLNPCG